jgi:hypothetical protein
VNPVKGRLDVTMKASRRPHLFLGTQLHGLGIFSRGVFFVRVTVSTTVK